MGEVAGRCMCGAVSYSSEAEPLFMGVCHCTECQRASGSALSMVVAVPAAEFDVDRDNLGTFVTVGDDHGQEVNRNFCASCGSRMFIDADSMPGVVIIHAGTLDDTSWFEPQGEIWGDSAQPWVPVHETRSRLPRGVPAA